MPKAGYKSVLLAISRLFVNTIFQQGVYIFVCADCFIWDLGNKTLFGQCRGGHGLRKEYGWGGISHQINLIWNHQMTERVKSYVIALAITFIGVFYFVTMRPGQEDWSGDFTMYIQNAMNIADGAKYDRSKYIFNPHSISLSPKTTPPVFPLLLVPVYKIFGLNIKAMKLEVGIIFLIFLSLLASLVRQRISFASLLSLLAVFSFHPMIVKFKNAVISDIPFLLFAYWTMYLIQEYYENKNLRTGFFYPVFLGVVMYLSYGTRSCGVVLPLSLLIYEFIHWRRISVKTLIVIGVFIWGAVIEELFFFNNKYYFQLLLLNDARSLITGLQINFHSFLYFWADLGHRKIQAIVFLSSMFFSLSGFITQMRRRISITEVFFILYLGSILSWPAGEGIRYFLPILPLYIFYLFCGIEFWGSQKVSPMYAVIRTTIFIGFLTVLIYSYGLRYYHWDYRAIPDGPYNFESQELFKFVREKTPPDAVFIFRKPTILAFFTGRRASTYQRPKNQDELWQYIRSIGTSYLILSNFLPGDPEYLSPFIKRYQKQLITVYYNKDYRVFKIIE